MKVGIVRHFRVEGIKHGGLMNSADFEEYIGNYDKAPVIENKIDIRHEEWARCYCSDLPRTVKTARSIYKGNIGMTRLLREVTMYPVRKSALKIPGFFWSVSARIAWRMNNKSQLETINTTAERAREFLRLIDMKQQENILIVSHGFFLLTLVKELRKLGFRGKIPPRLENGCLYIFENTK